MEEPKKVISFQDQLRAVIAKKNTNIAPAYNVVQGAVSNSDGSSVTSTTATFGATATSGNLIVAASGLRLRSETITFDGTGWTYVEQKDTTAPSAAIAYKVSDGTETSVTASHLGTSQRMALGIVEIENVQTGSIASAFVDNGTSATGSFSTGTVSGETQFPQMALGVWAGADSGVDPGSRSYTSGYTEVASATTRPSTAFRAHVIMAIGTVESGSGEITLTTTNASVQGLSALVMTEDDNAT